MRNRDPGTHAGCPASSTHLSTDRCLLLHQRTGTTRNICSGYLPFAGGGRGGGGGGGGDQPAQPPQPPALPPRYVLPRYPAPPQMPDPPVPWKLVDGAIAPYDEFKPKILKEVDDFKGDSDDITQFFLKCELHFDVFNRHYRHPPS